jgi:hypothetical protein
VEWGVSLLQERTWEVTFFLFTNLQIREVRLIVCHPGFSCGVTNGTVSLYPPSYTHHQGFGWDVCEPSDHHVYFPLDLYQVGCCDHVHCWGGLLTFYWLGISLGMQGGATVPRCLWLERLNFRDGKVALCPREMFFQEWTNGMSFPVTLFLGCPYRNVCQRGPVAVVSEEDGSLQKREYPELPHQVCSRLLCPWSPRWPEGPSVRHGSPPVWDVVYVCGRLRLQTSWCSRSPRGTASSRFGR